MKVDILDSGTFQRLHSLEFPRETLVYSEAPIFSPDSRMLTSFIRGYHYRDTGGFVVSWDLQTGGVVSAIEWKGPRDTKVGRARITYSMNGKTIAVLSRYTSSTIISIYDVLSGVHTHDIDHLAPASALRTPYMYKIWAHGESLRFATPGPTGITILEVGFAPGATPMEIETVSVPKIHVETFVFEPRGQTDIAWTAFHTPSCRLAFVDTGGALIVWDARASKFLLHHTDNSFFGWMTFSSDGRLFACTTIESEIYLWKESPTGYSLFEKLTPNTPYSKPRLSPNGQSVIAFSGSMIQLWPTKGFTTPTTPSSVSAQAPQHTGNFLLEFLPDSPLVAFARKKDKTVTVFDLKSGVPQLTIDTSIDVYGLRPIGGTIVVIGQGKVITWNLPGGNFLPDARMSVEDSTQTIDFRIADPGSVIAASVSLDFQYIALLKHVLVGRLDFLGVHCTSTGRNFRIGVRASALWFAPGGQDIWCAADNEAMVFSINHDGLNHTKTVVGIGGGSWGCPWGSSRGYEVTDDGWILGAGGKRLLMLPPLWHSRLSVDRVWDGEFLALLHGTLPEPVILELEP